MNSFLIKEACEHMKIENFYRKMTTGSQSEKDIIIYNFINYLLSEIKKEHRERFKVFLSQHATDLKHMISLLEKHRSYLDKESSDELFIKFITQNRQRFWAYLMFERLRKKKLI